MPMNFDAIVSGTGFGGTIAVTRLAAKGKKVTGKGILMPDFFSEPLVHLAGRTHKSSLVARGAFSEIRRLAPDK